MTTPSASDDDLVVEQATNRRYRDKLDEKTQQRIEVVGPANTNMAGNLHTPMGHTAGCLIGRVGLAEPGPDDPTSFHIGPRYLDQDGLTVFSWAAPVAKVFFDPLSATHPFADAVAVVRTLTTRLDDVTGLHDDWVRSDVDASPFETTESLYVTRPRRATRRRAPAPPPSRQPDPSSNSKVASLAGTEPAGSIDEIRGSADAVVLRDGDLRAESAVRIAIAAPRTGAMSSVLSTLQPWQYDAVTRSSDVPLVLQGHPGTGKTVIAVHRAAFLVNPANEGQRPRRVLLLGPTRDWRKHIEPTLSQLVEQGGHEGTVTARDLPGLLAELADLQSTPVGTPDGLSDDIELRLAGLAAPAASELKRRHGWKPTEGSRRKKVRAIYEEVRDRAREDARTGADAALMTALRPWDNAVHERRLLPLLAQCAIALLGDSAVLPTFDHVIVDEAQDLTPIEWTIIDRLNVGGGWTIVGDMNQRRTDHTYLNWSALQHELGIEWIVPTVIDTGFRSSQQILDFAADVLPSGEKGFRSLQVGPEVTVERAGSIARLRELAVTHAHRLLDAYPAGTVAIYAEQAAGLIPLLQAAGWRKSEADSTIEWIREGRRLSLHSPISGRGIEFDGVVVMEPADFRSNLGRSGPLYTTLTRANRELAVVHHTALPDGLRRRARS